MKIYFEDDAVFCLGGCCLDHKDYFYTKAWEKWVEDLTESTCKCDKCCFAISDDARKKLFKFKAGYTLLLKNESLDN